MKIVSFVIPCYNDPSNLPAAVASCLAQRVKCEVIVIDDCSSDRSFEVAQSLAGNNPEHVRALRTGQNAGPAAARNLGARRARGDLLCFLDSDDSYLPGFARACVGVLAKHPDIAAVKTGVEIINLDGTFPTSPEDPRHRAITGSYPCNMMLRRDAFELTGGFPEDTRFRGPLGGEDIALYQALKLLKVVRIAAPLVRHNNRPGSHLERFLKRSSVKEGRVVIAASDPDLGEKDVSAAVREHVRAAKGRMLGIKALLSHVPSSTAGGEKASGAPKRP
jgi:glycosyltransferase involved in cell wall biosynthesis